MAFTLEREKIACHRLRVLFPRLLFLLLASLPFVGCQTGTSERYPVPSHKYFRVRVTNPRGELIADWIAEGHVARTERGFRFKAVERHSAPPYEMVTEYPNGRQIEVAGPNIVVTPAGKPYWLHAMDTATFGQ